MTDVEPLRILVTGWRHWPEENRGVIWDALEAVRAGVLPFSKQVTILHVTPNPMQRPVIVRHGQCPYGGADLWADRWAVEHGHLADRHPADKFGKDMRIAGPLRNTWMVENGPRPDICLAFPGPTSAGTWDCVRKAVRKGIETVVIGFGNRFYSRSAPTTPIKWPTSNMDALMKGEDDG